MRLGFAASIIPRRVGGLLPVVLTGSIVGVAVLAWSGLWQLAWAVQQVSSSLGQQHAQLEAPALLDVSHPGVVAGGAEPGRLQPAAVATPSDTPGPDLPASAPRVQLEEPNPIPEVSPPAYSPPPACDDIFVYIVSISPRFPERSAASIASGPAAPGRFRRLGQSIEDWEVTAIRDDWSGLNPEVWLSRGEQVCRAELAGNAARAASRPAPEKRKRKRRRSR